MGTAAAVAGGVCIVCFIGSVLLALLVLGVVFVLKAKSKGVVFRDGLTEEEWKLTRQAIEETLKVDTVQIALGKVANATQKAMQRKQQ